MHFDTIWVIQKFQKTHKRFVTFFNNENAFEISPSFFKKNAKESRFLFLKIRRKKSENIESKPCASSAVIRTHFQNLHFFEICAFVVAIAGTMAMASAMSMPTAMAIAIAMAIAMAIAIMPTTTRHRRHARAEYTSPMLVCRRQG